VVEARDDVAAQARVGECSGDGGRESDGVQRRVDAQGDPPGHIVVGQACGVGVLLFDDEGEALVLDDGAVLPGTVVKT
jgi:hypothetical protein